MIVKGGSAEYARNSTYQGLVDLETHKQIRKALKHLSGVAGENTPIACHAWPKIEGPNRYGIGPIVWGEEANSLIDVEGDYDLLNDITKMVCQELGLHFINMR